jgi:hypothetical protein
MDRSKREQLVIVVRYVKVENNVAVIKEDPICLIDAMVEVCESSSLDPLVDEVQLSGERLARLLIKKCIELGLDLRYLVGLGMDGASNLRSVTVGAAAILLRDAPLAFYFHCMMHILNLCASQANSVPSVRNCIDSVRELISFFNTSPKRHHLLQKVIESSPVAGKKSLKKMCTTRFVERHDALIIVDELLPSLQIALEKICLWESREARVSANGLLQITRNFQFIICLKALSKVSSVMVGLSRLIQGVGIDIIKALEEIRTLEHLLDLWRSNVDEEFRDIHKSAITLANTMEVEVKKPRTTNHSIYHANAGDTDDVETYYRVNMFIPLLDGILKHIKDRFGPTQSKVLSLSRLIPAYIGTFDDIIPAIHIYSDFLDVENVVRGEFLMWKEQWKVKESDNGSRSA